MYISVNNEMVIKSSLTSTGKVNLKLTTNLLYECTGFCDEIKVKKTDNINGVE